MAFANLVARGVEKRQSAQRQNELRQGSHQIQTSAIDRQLKGYNDEENSLLDEEIVMTSLGHRGGGKVGRSRGFDADMKKEFMALNKDLDDFESKLFGSMDDDFMSPPKPQPPPPKATPPEAVYARVGPGVASAHNFAETRVEVSLPQPGQEYQPGRQWQPNSVRQHAPPNAPAPSFLVSEDVPPNPLPPIFVATPEIDQGNLPIDRLLASVPMPAPPAEDAFVRVTPAYDSEDMFARPPGTLYNEDDMFARSPALNMPLPEAATKYRMNDEEELDEDEMNDADLVRDLVNLKLGPSFGSIEDLKEAARAARRRARQRRMQLGHSKPAAHREVGEEWHGPPTYPPTTYQPSDEQQPWNYEEGDPTGQKTLYMF